MFQVVRFADKDFRQRRPDGNSGYIWNVKGLNRVVYRLPEIQEKDAIFIAEGEKDAERLWSVGLPATTCSGGAQRWGDRYTDQLKTAGVKRVAILPDNDDAGRKHAEQVAASCHRAGIDARIVTLPGLPDKGDVSDYLDNHTKDELAALTQVAPVFEPKANSLRDKGAHTKPPALRTIKLTPASSITVRPVRWLEEDRLPLGTLGLLGGREGIGKTIYASTLAASITRGTLSGVYHGTPRAVIVAATEDSWEHTIVPRLMAAGANLDLVYRVDVETAEGTDTMLSLPCDLVALERAVRDVQAAMVLLDPLLSRLDADLDTHKDAEVRMALEPLVKLADAVDVYVLGIIHVNKGSSTDPLTLLMGSRAFAAVARSVLFVLTDPEDETPSGAT